MEKDDSSDLQRRYPKENSHDITQTASFFGNSWNSVEQNDMDIQLNAIELIQFILVILDIGPIYH